MISEKAIKRARDAWEEMTREVRDHKFPDSDYFLHRIAVDAELGRVAEAERKEHDRELAEIYASLKTPNGPGNPVKQDTGD